MGVKKAVEARSQSLRPKQRIIVLLKLQEHERKMADLASKFIVRSFEHAPFCLVSDGLSDLHPRRPLIGSDFDTSTTS
jgi:hypothetical protein